MDRHLSRRRLLRAIGASAGWAGVSLAGVGGCGKEATPVAAVTKNMRMSWWGSTERHKRTQDALASFTRRHPDIKVDTQFSGSDGYWEKLGTQVTSGSLPDVIQMDYVYIAQYAGKGYVRALDDFVPTDINLTGFSDDVLVGGRIDGKLYGVNNGINSTAMVVNKTMLQQLSLDLPDHTMTWADFAKLAKQIGKKAPAGVFGSEYAGYTVSALECWLRQRGKGLYGPDGGTPACSTSSWPCTCIRRVRPVRSRASTSSPRSCSACRPRPGTRATRQGSSMPW